MSVQDFPPRPDGADFDSAQHKNWLDALRNRQNIDALNTVSTVSSADETYLFSVSASKTYKATVSQIVSAVNLTAITASLAGDVALNSTTQYFDGPTVSQGVGGTWFASGTVTLFDAANASNYLVKLWDGTTVIASTQISASAGLAVTASLSGVFVAPTGDIRISAKDNTQITGLISFNLTGNSKDSTITAERIG